MGCGAEARGRKIVWRFKSDKRQVAIKVWGISFGNTSLGKIITKENSYSVEKYQKTIPLYYFSFYGWETHAKSPYKTDKLWYKIGGGGRAARKKNCCKGNNVRSAVGDFPAKKRSRWDRHLRIRPELKYDERRSDFVNEQGEEEEVFSSRGWRCDDTNKRLPRDIYSVLNRSNIYLH